MIAVFVLAMGGPDSLDAVAPFLRNLLADPLIFPVPGGRFLAPLIARLRAREVRSYYARIGGGSPIIATTEAQARALEDALGGDFRTFPVFRYWGRDARDAVARARAAGATRGIALPLYPQWCRATTLSSLLELRGAAGGLELIEVERYGEDPGYLEALARGVRSRLWPGATVLLSAHGVPASLPRSGDPYVREVEATARALAARLPGVRCELGWQSRVGPMRWVEPSTEARIRRLAAEGVRELLVVPLTFVSDHVETLDELDIRMREVATAAGVTRFERVPALGCDPGFIEALARLTRVAAAG